MSLKDRISGRLKKAAGDLSGDASLTREGEKEERKADAKEELDAAHERVEHQAGKVQDLERDTDPPAGRR